MRRKRHGFTLTELLVMIAMAGMFAAVLMPALSEEGEKENAVICENNLRQIGRAIEMYKQDNDGWFPANFTLPYGSGGSFGWTWREAIWDGYLGMQREPGHFPTPNPEIFNCPSDRAETQREPAASYNMNTHRYLSVMMDGIGRGLNSERDGPSELARPTEGSWWTHDNWVEDPSGTFSVLDGRSIFYGWRYYDTVQGPPDLLPPLGEDARRAAREISPQGPKHFGGYNFLFCDGSVRRYKLEETVGKGEYDLDSYEALGMWSKIRGN